MPRFSTRLVVLALLGLVLVGPDLAAAADGALMTALKKFLGEDKWKYAQVDGKPMLRMGFQGREASWTCIVQVDEERSQIYLYSILPENVPADRRLAVAEYLTRANYGLKLGNFEMDWSDGQVLYKTSLNVEGGSLTSPMLKSLLYANVLTVDRYLSGLARVAQGKATPEQAITDAEKKASPQPSPQAPRKSD